MALDTYNYSLSVIILNDFWQAHHFCIIYINIYLGIKEINCFVFWQGQLLIETQENILEKFRQGIMANKKKKPRYTEVKVEEDEEDLDDSKG